jgi:ribosome biogenesis GTPase / thiamine phosphate phosphatase
VGGHARTGTLSPRGGYAQLDEDDVRVRPGRGSRPRTRRRPAHEGAVPAFVTSVDRGRYGCMADGRLVVAMKARELGRGSVVVGDRVALAGDTSGAEGTLARIVRVEPRTSALRRSPDDTDPMERIIVANADQMVIVCALAAPPPRLRFVDRCLVAAYDAELDPLLLLTKADLAPQSSPRKIRAFYAPLGLPTLTTRRPLPPRTLGRVRNVLTGRISVLIGQSGVGKSTLVNILIPEAARTTGTVNPVTGRGRHTSSSAVALPLGDGWLIDTPGLRGFGLGHVSAERVVEAFGDLAEGTAGCPPGCDHLSPGCALDEWAREHHAEARLDSLRRLLRSREGTGPD